MNPVVAAMLTLAVGLFLGFVYYAAKPFFGEEQE